jgi:hypothetical protein
MQLMLQTGLNKCWTALNKITDIVLTCQRGTLEWYDPDLDNCENSSRFCGLYSLGIPDEYYAFSITATRETEASYDSDTDMMLQCIIMGVLGTTWVSLGSYTRVGSEQLEVKDHEFV